MTDKQKCFCDEYIIDCNATRAYRAAYPSIKNDATARANGSRLLANANIKRYVDERMAEISSQRVASATEIMEYLTSVMRGESSAEIVVVEGEGDGCSSAKKVSKAPDEKEKLRAAEMLGKRYGLFSENANSAASKESVRIIDDI